MAFVPPQFSGMETYSDEQIVKLVLQGQVELFELLMRRYNRRLFRMTRAILKDDAEAEDVMQEAYVRAYENLTKFRGESSFATWLTRIAVHEALARAKRRGLIEPIEDAETEAVPEMPLGSSISNPEEMAAQRELKVALEAAIDSLPMLYRSVIVLRYVEELSVRETAECLEISEEAARIRSHRGRALMRRFFKAHLRVISGEIFPLHLPLCNRVVAGTFRRLNSVGQTGAQHSRTG